MDEGRWETEEQKEIAVWLAPWLESNGYSQYLHEVVCWCEEAGAADVEEVERNWQDIAMDIGLACNDEDCSADLGSCQASQMSTASILESEGGDPRFLGDEEADVEAELGRFGPVEAPYVMVEEIGRGATGTVYRCKRGASQYAAKVIELQQLAQAPNYEEKINREIQQGRRLRGHPNIVELVDVVKEPGRWVLVMELLEGGTLFDYICLKKRLDAPVARHIFVQVARALEHMHANDIVHRDLKPENILIDSASSRPGLPTVKITDFGHSRTIRDGYCSARALSVVVGTRLYSAPEISPHAQDGYDERSDLWSFGVILYLMIMGKHDPQGYLKKDFYFRGSREIDELVRGLLSHKPEDRISLRDCLESSWVTNSPSLCTIVSKQLEVQGACQREVKFRLPHAPLKVQALQAELASFSTRHPVAARLDVLDVIATFYEGPERMANCTKSGCQEQELIEIILRHVPDFQPPPGSRTSSQISVDSADLDDDVVDARREELLCLEATYRDELLVLAVDEWVITLCEDAALHVRLNPGYPVCEPPMPTIKGAEGLLRQDFVAEELMPLWSDGEFCVCVWAERVREAIGEAQGSGAQAKAKDRFASLVGTWAQRELSRLSPGETRILPASLTGFHRLVIHKLCERLGWKSESQNVPRKEASTSKALGDGFHDIPPGDLRPLIHDKAEKPTRADFRKFNRKLQHKPLRQLSVTRPHDKETLRPKDVGLKDFLPKHDDRKAAFLPPERRNQAMGVGRTAKAESSKAREENSTLPSSLSAMANIGSSPTKPERRSSTKSDTNADSDKFK